MPAEKEIRKLTAILHADVKGYNRLMGEGESSTARMLTGWQKIFSARIFPVKKISYWERSATWEQRI